MIIYDVLTNANVLSWLVLRHTLHESWRITRYAHYYYIVYIINFVNIITLDGYHTHDMKPVIHIDTYLHLYTYIYTHEYHNTGTSNDLNNNYGILS